MTSINAASSSEQSAAIALLPSPVQDEDSAWFWEGTRHHGLWLQECRRCGEVRFPPMPRCSRCGSPDSAAQHVDPVGTVYSWITVHRPMSGLQATDIPCTFVVVALAVGCRMVGRVTGTWAGSIGDAVVGVFVDHQDWTEVRFAPVAPMRSGS
jgi:uncharacterized OB-fold protein